MEENLLFINAKIFCSFLENYPILTNLPLNQQFCLKRKQSGVKNDILSSLGPCRTLRIIRDLKSLFALLGLEFPDVELELFAFEDVSICASDLTGAGRDGRQNTTSLELLL